LEKIEEFKEFVRKLPGLKDEVASGKTTWQNLYEAWYLYGAEDAQWKQYEAPAEQKSSSATSTESVEAEIVEPKGDLSGTEMISQAFEYLQKVDIDKVQKTMGTFQQFIQIFQSMQGKTGGAAAAGSLLGSAASKQNYSGFFSQFDD